MDSIRLGLIGELKVMIELLLRGYNPAKSYLDSGIDLIIENGIRIQVKSCGQKPTKDGYVRFNIGKGNKKLSVEQSSFVDFLILWIKETDDFYIIPASKTNFLKTIALPTRNANKIGFDNSKWLPYKNNWKFVKEVN